MTSLTEGRLQFDFDGDDATKYDEWSFYRAQFEKICNGNKAVDFIFVDGDETWLIEVKDYRRHPTIKTIDLADEIALKVRDTLAGIVAAKLNANEAAEKNLARRALQKRRLRVVLHLEQPTNRSKLFPTAADPAKLQQKLKQKIGAIDPHPLVVNRHRLHRTMNWTVTGIGICP
ncbi:hypothetical protein MIT9_P0153 [Methylomarinovum caldicuralii]|uniref:Cysteinyl-tRNA synthetase n=1 Tax=Methylomarinovum caldicuralii TaxID=438856 RepID=A0AAU9C476_9GAMM|nr:hypothetical protein [Methylomarinovum caldicuralii]BCX80579.1 hypothetical protein MIT9_P0153 [Methylomarinovum caldicuralii]